MCLSSAVSLYLLFLSFSLVSFSRDSRGFRLLMHKQMDDYHIFRS